jgi:hypothetical protein
MSDLKPPVGRFWWSGSQTRYFAVDSVPAIFAITTDPYIVYTSNIFAILGLRALYFTLAAMVHRFHYLKYALSGGVIVSLLRTREAESPDGTPKAAE